MGAIYISISGWRYAPWRGAFYPPGLAQAREHALYASGYEDESLARWAARIRAWAENGDVYCYFDNDIKVRAPFDTKRLMEMVGVDGKPAA